MAIPKKVQERIKTGIKTYSKILEQVKSRDINESDTAKICADMLSDIFGYDKYLEITSEYAIRSTFCDLAIKQNDEVTYLIECKAVGIELKEIHLRQAIEYASTEGIDWAILTNGHTWKVYRVIYGKPVTQEEVFTLDFLAASAKDAEFIEKVYVLTKEAVNKSIIEVFHEKAQLVNKFTVSALLLSDDALKFIRKQLRSVSKQIKVDTETLKAILKNDVIKREIVDSDEIKAAARKVTKTGKRGRPRKKKEELDTSSTETSEDMEQEESISSSDEEVIV